jgi:hypothetical protein
MDQTAESFKRKISNLTWWGEPLSFTGSKVGFVNNVPGAAAFLDWLLGRYIDKVMVNCRPIHLVATSNAAIVPQTGTTE